MTIGLYMQELIRHVDPAHRTLGRFFHEEIASRSEIEFYIGLPPGDSRRAARAAAALLSRALDRGAAHGPRPGT